MTKTVRLTTILAAGLVCFAVFGQDKPGAKKKGSEAAMPPMPKPAAEMKELRDFIGVWTTDEKFEPSPMMPAGGTATGTNTARLGPGGFSVLMDQRSKSSMGPFVGHGVFTWDPNDKVYRFVWTDSMSPGMVIETGRKEGDTLVFTGEMMMMGKKMAVKDVMSDRTPTSYTLTSYMNDGSGEKKAMTIKFTKQESPAAKK
jgi:Protein of unknown function (DUF1579)